MKVATWVCSLLLLASVACDDDPTAPRPGANGSVQIRPAVARTVDGGTVELGVVAFTGGGTPAMPPAVEWSSLDPDRATVDGAGTVTAVAPGWARITATAGALADTAEVAIGIRFASLEAGRHGCGISMAGEAYCWSYGGDWFGSAALGAGDSTSLAGPFLVSGGVDFDRVDPGVFITTCGLAAGDVYCWGADDYGALGYDLASCTGTVIFNACYAPTPVPLPAAATDLAAGRHASCASTDGGVYCWGHGLVAGPTAGGSPGQPRLVDAALTGDVAVGALHACALAPDHRAWCWGENWQGALGLPDSGSSHLPRPIQSAVAFEQLVTGAAFACGRTADGAVYCWGQYEWSSGLPGPLPVRIDGGVQFVDIDAGDQHVCGLDAAGAAYCWGGMAWSGALGLPISDEVVAAPRLAAPGHRFTSIAAAELDTCGILDSGAGLCFGILAGAGTMTYAPHPIMPPGAPPGNGI